MRLRLRQNQERKESLSENSASVDDREWKKRLSIELRRWRGIGRVSEMRKVDVEVWYLLVSEIEV